MKHAWTRARLPIVGVTLGLLAAGSWMVWHPRAGSAKTPPVSSSSSSGPEALLAIPAVSNPTTSDREVARWAERAKKNLQDATAWVNLGDALMQKARETYDLSYYGRAEKVYQQALVVNPKKSEAMVGLAWVNGGRHEFEQSIAWAKRALALDPKSNEAYGLIGDAEVEMGDYDQAFVDYQQMLDLRPDISSYSRGAHLLHLSGNTRKALWLMDKAITTGGAYSENTAWCRAQKALILFSTGAYLPAEQVLTEGLKSAPHNYHLLVAMGKVKAAKKDYPAAIDSYKKAIAIAPQIDTVIALGDLYALTGKKDEAEKQYALVEAIHKLQQANGVKGELLVAQFYADHDRNLPEALKMAEEEYKTRKNVYAADMLSWCYYKNGRYQEALKLAQEAEKRQTQEALFDFHRGMIYAKLGDSQSARRCLYDALSQNSNFHPLYAPMATQTIQSLGAVAQSKEAPGAQ